VSGDYPAEAEILDRLERVRVLLGHALRVRQVIAGADEAARRFVTENVEPGFVPRAPEVDAALAAIDAEVTRRLDGQPSRFDRLVRLLDLDPLEVDLLLCTVAPAVRRGFRETFRMLGAEASPGIHPVAHLLELVASSPESQARARAAVHDRARLLASGALLIAGGAASAPPLWRPLAPSPTVYLWLLGDESPYALLDDQPLLRRAVCEEVSLRLDSALGAGARRLVLVGDPGVGRTRAAAAVAHRLERRAAILPADPVDVRPAVLDARLRERLLFVDAAAAGTEADAVLRALIRAASAAPELPVVVSVAPRSAAAARLVGAGFARVEVTPATLASQVRAWESALGSAVGADAIADIVRGHSLELGAIEEAAAEARVNAGPSPAPRALLAAAERAARAFTSERLSHIADRLSTTLSWDDLILPGEVRAAVDEVWRAAAVRRTVYEEWGFAERTPYGRAISAVFTGPPGTGKTMVATLIARELGVELYRVDLSRLVDKYIGETEKHLATLFAEAERGRCVLLFDEADAIFGKRTKSGESATERYANLEVNYLLQRIEAFSGIVILTTNQESMMDEAFKRRLRYRVEFPFPEEEERAALWRRLIAPDAPVAADVDPDALARRFELSGGHIKNAVLRAAFAAAADATHLDQARLIAAANQELEKIGKLVIR